MSKKLARREFLKIVKRLVSALGFVGVLGPVVAFFYPSRLENETTVPVQVSPVVELPVGESRKVPFGRYPAIVINTAQGLRAYSAVCTHFSCIVYWNPESDMIECPCHAGFYDVLDGSVISGPPPKALKRLSAEVVEGMITIKS